MKKKFLFSILITFVIILTGCNKNNKTEEFIGKWNTVSAVNAQTGKETKNLRDLFGSSYEQFGSYLKLNKDGTFIDAIVPITDGSKSNTGKYTIKKDYLKKGDTYIILSYKDGNKKKLQKVSLDDTNTTYLVLDNLINGYQLYFKK